MKRVFVLLALLTTMLLLTITACTPGNGEPPVKQQRIYKISNYTAEDNLIYYDIYSYDSNNRLITDTYYDQSDRMNFFVGFDYDSNNHLFTASVYDSSSSLIAYSQSSYDGSGLMDRLTFYVPGYLPGNAYFYNAYTYDAGGKRVGGGTYYYPLYTLQSSWELEYNVNDLTDKVTFYDGSHSTTSHETFEYDASGKMVTIWVYDSSDTLTKRSDLSYDTDGKIVKESNYAYKDGNAVLNGYSTVDYEEGAGNYSLTAQSGDLNDFFAVLSSVLPLIFH